MLAGYPRRRHDRRRAAQAGNLVFTVGFGFRVLGLGFEVQSLGFRVWGLQFRL